MSGLAKKGKPKRSKRKVYHCYWCGRRITKHEPRDDGTVPGDALTREHLIPVSKGGGNGRNVVYACRKCNMERGDDMTWKKGCRISA